MKTLLVRLKNKHILFLILAIIIFIFLIANYIKILKSISLETIIALLLLFIQGLIAGYLLFKKGGHKKMPLNDKNYYIENNNNDDINLNLYIVEFLKLLKENNQLLNRIYNYKENSKQPSNGIIINKKKIHAIPIALIKKKEKPFLSKIDDIIGENYDNPMFGVQQLADKLYMSRSQLYRKYKSKSDIPIAVYLRKFRLKKAKELLIKTDNNISQIMYKTGFINLTSFSRAFKSEFGKSPRLLKIELDKSYTL